MITNSSTPFLCSIYTPSLHPMHIHLGIRNRNALCIKSLLHIFQHIEVYIPVVFAFAKGARIQFYRTICKCAHYNPLRRLI